MKSILLFVRDDEGFEARLQAALDLARASGGHLNCLRPTPTNAYVAYEGWGGAFTVGSALEELDKQMAAFRARLEERLSREDVPWEFNEWMGEPAAALVVRSALSDVIVLSQPGRRTELPEPLGLAGDVAVYARTPILVVPNAARGFDPTRPVAIGWNGSFEAANAIRASLPLLRRATAVHILTIEDDSKDHFPSTAASEYLARHDIASELHCEPAGGASTDAALTRTAQRLGAGTLVMGAYGQSRARQFLFGGVTRSLLKNSPIPLLIAH